MAPIKLEDNIREKLEEREIQPSAGAWNELETQLLAKSEKKSNKIVWYAVAASLVSALIVASLVFNRATNTSNETELVEVNSSEEDDINNTELAIPDLNTSEEKNENSIVSEEIKTPIKSEELKNTTAEVIEPKKEAMDKVIQPEVTTEAIAKNDLPNGSDVQQPIKKEDSNKNEDIINKKLNEVIAQVEELEASNSPITMEEIDALLASAQGEIQTQRVLNSKKVDPVALLGDVEWELEKSFRDKVYDALSDGYDFIKTAVVERNN